MFGSGLRTEWPPGALLIEMGTKEHRDTAASLKNNKKGNMIFTRTSLVVGVRPPRGMALKTWSDELSGLYCWVGWSNRESHLKCMGDGRLLAATNSDSGAFPPFPPLCIQSWCQTEVRKTAKNVSLKYTLLACPRNNNYENETIIVKILSVLRAPSLFFFGNCGIVERQRTSQNWKWVLSLPLSWLVLGKPESEKLNFITYKMGAISFFYGNQMR